MGGRYLGTAYFPPPRGEGLRVGGLLKVDPGSSPGQPEVVFKLHPPYPLCPHGEPVEPQYDAGGSILRQAQDAVLVVEAVCFLALVKCTNWRGCRGSERSSRRRRGKKT